jgi:two-component system chemotaxis response regulator CheY
MTRRVLVDDDALFMRSLIKGALRPPDFEIAGEAADGGEAVEKYRLLKPDVVTLDITMPTMNGLEALRRIRSEDPGARIVMVTAVDQAEILLEAVKLGAADFIVKPFDPERVRSAVEKAAAGGQAVPPAPGMAQDGGAAAGSVMVKS